MLDHFMKMLAAFRRQTSVVRVLILSGIAGVVVSASLAFLLFLVWAEAFGPLPTRTELKLAGSPSASEVYSSDSVLLGRYFIQERSPIAAAEMPIHVVAALIATEDVRYFDHRGIDRRSMFRVFLRTFLLQESTGGGSTLTQQLAKNLYPRRSYPVLSVLINKMREMVIAHRLESVYDKPALILLYLNTVPFGENTYGLEAASRLFFSIPARQLSIEQGATLVGMLKANHAYNPRLFPDRSRERRNVVLGQLEKYGWLPPEEADSLKALPLVIQYNKITHHSGLGSYFREYLRPRLVEWCDEYNKVHEEPVNLYTSGLKIYTTIDSRLQRYAEEAVAEQMKRIQQSFTTGPGGREPWKEYPGMLDEVIRRSEHYQRLKNRGLTHDEIIKEMERAVPMTVFTWDGDREVVMSPVDSLKHYLRFLQAGVLAVDPSNGAIRVWVGGIQHRWFQFDHVKESTRRQVGSTFKPIVYASALEQGVRPCAFIPAQKITYTNMEDWTPVNTDENYKLKYSMPGALALSVNTVSIQLLEKAGIDNTIRLARRMGIQSELSAVPSLALGTSDISVYEMVGAYTAFANEGMVVTPFAVTSIQSDKRTTLEEFKVQPPQPAISKETAVMVLHMLRRAVNEGGTSAGLKSRFGLNNDIGGKTGTTQSNTDGWFVGVTPNLVVGAWVGADDPRIRMKSLSQGQGSRTALPIVGDFFQRANRDGSIRKSLMTRFPEIDSRLAARLDCPFSKEETSILKKLFTNSEKEKKREFGKPKKRGFLKRLFGRKEKVDSVQGNK